MNQRLGLLNNDSAHCNIYLLQQLKCPYLRQGHSNQYILIMTVGQRMI